MTVGVTWQEGNALCITPDDTTSRCMGLNGMVTGQFHSHSTKPHQKKERNSDVTLMSTGLLL